MLFLTGERSDSQEFSYEDDFLFDQNMKFDPNNMKYDIKYENDTSLNMNINQDLFKMGGGENNSWGAYRRSSSLGGGSFDLTGSFFEGLGAVPTGSRKNSLSLPSAAARVGGNNSNNSNNNNNNGSNSGGGGGGVYVSAFGDVDLSAYQSMAVSLQAQTEAHQVRSTLCTYFLRLELIRAIQLKGSAYRTDLFESERVVFYLTIGAGPAPIVFFSV